MTRGLWSVLPMLALAASGWAQVAQVSMAATCPVDLAVERMPVASQVQVTQGMDAPGLGIVTPGMDAQRVRLQVALRADDGKRGAIRSIAGTVFGISATGQFVLAQRGRKADRQGPFVLRFSPHPAADKAFQWSSEVSLPAVSAVTQVVVTSIEFADGTSWQAQKDAACSAEPNPLLPVARD